MLTGSRVNFVLTAPRNRAVHAAVEVGGRPRTFPSAAARPLHPPTPGGAASPACLLTKANPAQLEHQSSSENLIHTIGMNAEPQCSRLVGCHSPRGASAGSVSREKKNGNQTLKFFNHLAISIFFLFESGNGTHKRAV